jgi:hypothetical protein
MSLPPQPDVATRPITADERAALRKIVRGWVRVPRAGRSGRWEALGTVTIWTAVVILTAVLLHFGATLMDAGAVRGTRTAANLFYDIERFLFWLAVAAPVPALFVPRLLAWIRRRRDLAADLRGERVEIERLRIVAAVRVTGTWAGRPVAWILAEPAPGTGPADGDGHALILHADRTHAAWWEPHASVGGEEVPGDAIELTRLPRSRLVVGQRFSGSPVPAPRHVTGGFGRAMRRRIKPDAPWNPPAHASWVHFGVADALLLPDAGASAGAGAHALARAVSAQPRSDRRPAETRNAAVPVPNSRPLRPSDLRAARIRLQRDRAAGAFRLGIAVHGLLAIAAVALAIAVSASLIPAVIDDPSTLVSIGFLGLMAFVALRVIWRGPACEPVRKQLALRRDVADGTVWIETRQIAAAVAVECEWVRGTHTFVVVETVDHDTLALPADAAILAETDDGRHRLRGQELTLWRLPVSTLVGRLRPSTGTASHDVEPFETLRGPCYGLFGALGPAAAVARRLNPDQPGRPPRPGAACDITPAELSRLLPALRRPHRRAEDRFESPT